MLATLNRRVVWPIVARKRKSRHLEYLRDLAASQHRPLADIEAAQLDALKQLLSHAYQTVPYYRRRWLQLGLHPSEVTKLADLQAFPRLTKADIRASGSELLSSVGDRSAWRKKTTSGSTGVPLTIYLDEDAAQWKAACTVRSDEWSGYRLGERVAKVWGNPEYRHEGLRGQLRNAILDRAVYLDTIQMTPERIREFAAALGRKPLGLVFGHAHSVYLVAQELTRLGVDTVRPNGVVTTAMPLYDWQRPAIRAAFGVEPTNRYGCEEVSLIASECEHHTGLHVAAESVHVEVAEGGKLLVTDLLNRAMPLIRYQIGDVARLATGVCACGRTLPRLASVEGRDADFVLTPAGTWISGISLTENFACHLPNVEQIQVVQESRTRLVVRCVPGADYGPATVAAAGELVHRLFGPRMGFEMDLVDAIPQEPSGKYRFCISNLPADTPALPLA